MKRLSAIATALALLLGPLVPATAWAEILAMLNYLPGMSCYP